jgi:4-hydroxybenzoate polyprenyltransferase
MPVSQADRVTFDWVLQPGRWVAYGRLLRPRQWTKNLIVLAALVFSGHWHESAALTRSLLAFAAFTLVASGVYCLNDLCDAKRDRKHPEKRFRPVACGQVTPAEAGVLALLLAAGGLGLAVALGLAFSGVLFLYAILNVGYSLRGKEFAIFDVMLVAAGFLLRALGGAVAIQVAASTWLLACTTFLALFLAIVKRRQELACAETEAAAHRDVLAKYTLPLLDQLTTSTLTATLLTYILYTFFAHEPVFMLTVGFVIYGLFRYLYLVHRHRKGGSPEEVLLSDRPILLTVGLWGITSAILVWLEH